LDKKVADLPEAVAPHLALETVVGLLAKRQGLFMKPLMEDQDIGETYPIASIPADPRRRGSI
jgi:hypothetical protein